MPPKSHTKSTLWRSGEQQSAHFTKLNPMQKVPVLKDDGFVLTESDAILKYLCRKYAVAEHWYPQQPERRARVDEYTAWHHTNTRPHAAKVFLLEVLFPTRSGSAVDEAGLARAVSQLDEPMFLRKQAFLCGDDITLADLRAHAGGSRHVLRGRPQLQRWRTRVQSALGDPFHDSHAVLYAIRDCRKAKL